MRAVITATKREKAVYEKDFLREYGKLPEAEFLKLFEAGAMGFVIGYQLGFYRAVGIVAKAFGKVLHVIPASRQKAASEKAVRVD
jgi:hypothetical protein